MTSTKTVAIAGKNRFRFEISTALRAPKMVRRRNRWLAGLRIFGRTALGLALGCLAANTVPRVTAAPLTLPLINNFQSGIGADWQTNVSAGAVFNVTKGAINFDAPAHARAFVTREADTDLITFSGRIIRWSAIYLVWNETNWCSVGEISPTPFGQFCTTLVTNGGGHLAYLEGTDFNAARWVRIRLGENYIQYSSSENGTDWLVLKTVERPASFTGAPRLLAAGKYAIPEDQPFAATKEFSTEDGRYGGSLLALRVEATPATEASMTPEALAEAIKPPVEPVNALLETTTTDPTYAEIVGHYPPMKSPREVVGVPNHPLAVGVDWLGRLDVGPWEPPVAWFETGNPPVPFATDSAQIRRRMLLGYLPVDTLTTERAGVRYELTLFGWSQDFSVNQPIYAYAQMKVRAENGAALPKEIALVTPDKKRQTWSLTPDASGQTAQFSLRFEFPKVATAAEISPAEFAAKLDAVAEHWAQALAPANRFDVPDQRVMEGYHAWLTYSFLNTKTINGYLEPHDGSGFYNEMFGISVSLHTMAMDEYGFTERATKVLGTQLHFQQPDGLYTQACGLCDPGSLLEALAHHYQMTGDQAWLRSVLPHIVSQCEWLIRQREAAPKDGMLRGLIKFRPYNDYPEPVYSYLGNAWCAQGMADIVKALKDIHAPEADRYAAAAKSYREDVLNSMAAAAFENDGLTLLPLEPDTHRVLKLNNYQGGGYYGLIVGNLLESGFLPPNDKRTSWIVDLLEQRNGLIAGLSEFEGGIDHAYTFGYLRIQMQRHDIRKTLLGFWSMFAFGMTRDTYSPVEVTMIKTGVNNYTLPHLYSCTQQLRLLRDLLLREDGHDLWLGQGIPTAWLEPGKHVAVSRAPSEFGDLSYRIDAHRDGRFHVSLNPPARQRPQEIHLCLRQPNDRAIATVQTVPAAPFRVSGQSIILPDLKIPVDIDVTFK